MTTAQDPFALKLQLLPNALDQVLALADLIGRRNEDGRFGTSNIKEAFDELRVPSPANISDRLASLARKGLVVRLGGSLPWAITPLGTKRVLEVIGAVDPTAVESASSATAGSEFAHARHGVIPAGFAPQKWVRPIGRLLESFPFDQNVFLMTRYPAGTAESATDPLAPMIAAIREALGSHHLALHMASDRQLDDDLLGNVAAHMWACRYGIGLLENRADRGLNHNVVIELGAMLMTGRRCALLRDVVTAPHVPTDFAGQLYKSLDFADLEEVQGAIHAWAARDLGLGSCPQCS